MPPVVRLGDKCAGHSIFKPRPNIMASENVLVNNLGAHRLGDDWDHHGCKAPGTPYPKAAEGSPTVFVNNLPLCRVGDKIDCGSIMGEGSPNVFAN